MANNDNQQERDQNRGQGDMTVSEAGKKGGDSTASSHGREFYQDIGHKGGQRVRELVNEGKEQEGSQSSDRETAEMDDERE